MKARLLKQLLNNTAYSVSNHNDYIAVGSPLCHDLIKLDKKTLTVTYALDTYREGRKCFEGTSRMSEKTELLFIWDKMHELVASGEIKDIIEGKDTIENPLPVFSVKDGILVESITDKYGWPNTDDNGICMYENTHFKTKEQAIENGIKEYEAGLSLSLDNLKERESELEKAKERVEKYKSYIANLKNIN
jgi:hypothetical protein